MKISNTKKKRWIQGIHLFLWAILLAAPNLKAQFVYEERENFANDVVRMCIEAYGGEIDSASLSFTFRDKLYKGIFESGNYEMSRQFNKDDSLYLDRLSNSGFVRTVNSQSVELSERWVKAYSNSINSVFYFVMLPFKLQDEAVILSYFGKQKTKNGEYFLVKVSFKQEGGGEDHQDEFRYWVNSKTYLLDFFAYSYDTDGGGVRFRAVEKRHQSDSGHIFQDYINYKANVGIAMDSLLYLYDSGKLIELSKIRLENLQFESIK